METSRQGELVLPVNICNRPPARDGQYDGHHHVGVLAVGHDAVGVLVDCVVVNIHIVVVTTQEGWISFLTPVIFTIYFFFKINHWEQR